MATLHGTEPKDPVDWALNGRLAISLSEAARLLDITPRHARDLVDEGVIRVIHLGAKRVVSVVELRRLLGIESESA
jgi:hypothetical protein